jgi:hypothetical protein
LRIYVDETLPLSLLEKSKRGQSVGEEEGDEQVFLKSSFLRKEGLNFSYCLIFVTGGIAIWKIIIRPLT